MEKTKIEVDELRKRIRRNLTIKALQMGYDSINAMMKDNEEVSRQMVDFKVKRTADGSLDARRWLAVLFGLSDEEVDREVGDDPAD